MDFYIKHKKIILINLLLLIVVIVGSFLLRIFRNQSQEGDIKPSSCLVLAEEWCGVGEYVELTAPWVAFAVEPGTPVFVPKDGVVSFTMLPIVVGEVELEVVTIAAGGMTDQA